MTRQAKLMILVGTNGTGKTSAMKKLLAINERNLVLPSGPFDPGWNGYPALSARIDGYLPNPDNPRQQLPNPVVDELTTFKGTKLLHVTDRPIYFNAVLDTHKGFQNGGLFLDDFRNYILTKGTLKSNVGELFRARRHKRLDIFMACHNWEDVSRDLVAFNPSFVIFKTTIPPTRNSVDKMANVEAFLAAVERVNRKAKENPYYCELFEPNS